MEDVSFKMMGHWGHLNMYKWSYGQKFTVNLSSFEPMLSYYAHRMCSSGFTQMFRPWTAHGSTFTGVSPSWTLAITSSLYGLKIIPKSVISLIDALFVFLRYTFFLIYIPAEITWTLYWRFLAFISEYFFENVFRKCRPLWLEMWSCLP